MRRGGGGACLALAALALLILSLTPTSAAASYDPIASGTATLSLDPAFGRQLASHGVRLSALAPAKSHGTALSLPVSEGSLDPTLGKGEIDTEGTLLFKRGRLGVPLRHLTVKTKREPLLAKVGGGQLKVASAQKLSFARQGFGSSFAAKGLRLSAKVATRLDKKLRLPGVFEQGQLLGSLRASAQPATTAILPTGRLTFMPDPAFLAKLNSLFVSANPIAPAELAPGPLFTLPFISAGTIAPDASAGIPRTGGSLEFLQLGAGQVFWHELWFDLSGRQVLAEVDIEATSILPGKLGQIPIATLDTSAAAIGSNPKARTVTVTNAGLALSAQSAAIFNQAFTADKEAFHPGDLLGAVSFTARGQ